MSRDVDINQLKRFYAEMFELAERYSHPSADSPVEDILYNIADWIEHVDLPKETHEGIRSCLVSVIEGLNIAGFNYYASFK